MSTTINTALKGKFIIEDVNGNVLSEDPNVITNWGMTRLTNFDKKFSQNYIRCLSDNLKRIFPGTGDNPTLASDFKLVSPMAPTLYDHFNEPSITGTKYSRAGNGNLLIEFVKGSRLEFKNPTLQEIKELGIGFNYDTEHTYNNNGLASNAALTCSPNGSAPGTFNVPPFVNHSDNIDFSLWSRALVLPIIPVENGDILIVKYILTIETDCDQVKENWEFDATSATANAMPPRKTKVMRKPFYSLLPGTGKVVTGGTISSFGVCESENGGRWGEVTGTPATNPQGKRAILPALEQPFVGRNEIHTFDNYLNVLFANFTSTGNSIVPATTSLSASLTAVEVGGTINENANSRQLRHSYRTLSADDTIICQHRFLFNPGEWPTFANSGKNTRNFNFLRFNFDYVTATPPVLQQPDQADRNRSGIFTALSADYDPYKFEQAMYVGLDYTFTFSRA